MFKKILTSSLALSLLFASAAYLPEGFASESALTARAAVFSDYEYKVLKDGTVEIVDCNGSDTDVTIPSAINGKKVTSIGNNAFEDCVHLESIKIPDSVTSIGEWAFARCSNLTSINIPKGVTIIEDHTFFCCSSLESIQLPHGLTSIGDGAFSGCKKISKITIPSTVTQIADDAFWFFSGTIVCYKGTEAEKYVKRNYFSYELLEMPVTQVSISKADVTGLKDMTYTGKALKPSPTVKLNKKTLKKGTDYTVTYKNNKKVGKATVTIKGKGNYTGTITKTFKINPKNTTVKKLTSPKTKQLKVTYKKVSGVTGYQVTYSTSKKFTKSTTKTATIKGVSKLSKTVKSLKKGKTYYVKVRTY